MPFCRRFEKQLARCARALAPANAGNSNAAKIAIIAITTSNSINVKPHFASEDTQARRFIIACKCLTGFDMVTAKDNCEPSQEFCQMQFQILRDVSEKIIPQEQLPSSPSQSLSRRL